MNRNKMFVLNCIFIPSTIILILNSLYFMTIANDLSKKIQIYEEKKCYIYRNEVK